MQCPSTHKKVNFRSFELSVMDGKGKNREKWSFFCCLPSSLTMRSVQTDCRFQVGQRLVNMLQVVNWGCWSFTTRSLHLPSPCFWQLTGLLLFLLICSVSRAHVLRVSFLPLCHFKLWVFTLCSILLCVLHRNIWGSYLMNSCQVLIPASVPDIIQML